MRTFIDTGLLIGAANERDSRHGDAVRILGELSDATNVTSDHVLIECSALLMRRSGVDAVRRFFRALRSGPLEIEFVGAVDLERALGILDRWSDQTFSLVDCTSFAMMERLGIARAATFDADFAIYRYGPDDERAFSIVR